MSIQPTKARELYLLDYIGRNPEPPPLRSIFVNRNLRMETIGYVGFDLDWTLAPYKRLPLEQLTFKLTIDRLISHFNYPTAIRSIEFRPDFSHRGLLIDKLAGTVIKMDRHRYVGRAFLGRSELDKGERVKLYRQNRIDLSRERFYHVDTLFELPEVNLFSELVELTQKRIINPVSHNALFLDIRSAIDSIHADGTLKTKILSRPELFLHRDPEVVIALRRLQSHGRKIFLLTNSEWYYTQGICSFLFDNLLPDFGCWRDLFDLIIVGAGKPAFFKKNIPFIKLDANGEDSETQLTPSWGLTYRAGSRDGLMSLFGAQGEKVLYIGDHIYGDIRWTRLSASWRTALIVSELEAELQAQGQEATSIHELSELKLLARRLGQTLDNFHDLIMLCDSLNITPPPDLVLALTRGSLIDDIALENQAVTLHTEELRRKIDSKYNPTWGSLFRQGDSKSLFAEQVDDFACVYTSRVSNFSFYGSGHYFRVPNDPLRHEINL